MTPNIHHPFFPDAEADVLSMTGGPEGLSPGEAGGEIARAALQTFAIYVDDDRYNVPTLYLLAASDEACARRSAESVLDDVHHCGVELWRGDVRLLALGSYAARPRR